MYTRAWPGEQNCNLGQIPHSFFAELKSEQIMRVDLISKPGPACRPKGAHR